MGLGKTLAKETAIAGGTALFSKLMGLGPLGGAAYLLGLTGGKIESVAAWIETIFEQMASATTMAEMGTNFCQSMLLGPMIIFNAFGAQMEKMAEEWAKKRKEAKLPLPPLPPEFEAVIKGMGLAHATEDMILGQTAFQQKYADLLRASPFREQQALAAEIDTFIANRGSGANPPDPARMWKNMARALAQSRSSTSPDLYNEFLSCSGFSSWPAAQQTEFSELLDQQVEAFTLPPKTLGTDTIETSFEIDSSLPPPPPTEATIFKLTQKHPNPGSGTVEECSIALDTKRNQYITQNRSGEITIFSFDPSHGTPQISIAGAPSRNATPDEIALHMAQVDLMHDRLTFIQNHKKGPDRDNSLTNDLMHSFNRSITDLGLNR